MSVVDYYYHYYIRLLMKGLLVLFCRLGWDDVGDFSSLADLLPAEANQPRVLGDSGLGRLPLAIPYVSFGFYN